MEGEEREEGRGGGGSRGKAERRVAVCVWTPRVMPDVKVETMALSGGCRLGVEPDSVEVFDSSVNEHGRVDDGELPPACSCQRQQRAESQGIPM